MDKFETHNKVLIIGAGPGGLCAAFKLVKSGIVPVIIEQQDVTGGQAKSICLDDVKVDVGNKQFYSRIPELIDFLENDLGCEMTNYVQRIGIVYNNKIFEQSSKYRGVRRGMPFFLLVQGLLDLVKSKLEAGRIEPANFEKQMHQLRGELFSKIFAQVYEEKVTGLLWKDVPFSKLETLQPDKNLISGLKRFVSHSKQIKSKQPLWQHPIQSTGKIAENITANLKQQGVPILFNSKVTGIDIDDNNLHKVTIQNEGGVSYIFADNVIVSAPLTKINDWITGKTHSNKVTPKMRSAIIVYLVMSGDCLFEHTFLRIATPNTPITRITNYNAYHANMVGSGKCCIGIELFLHQNNVDFTQSDNWYLETAISFCKKANLIDADKIINSKVLRIPFGEAGLSPKDYLVNEELRSAYNNVNLNPKLYYITRTGLDRSMHAGLLAAAAILENKRELFLSKTNQLATEPWLD
ncbi:MAG: NAD(P)-binding protein [Chitinophagales bacterium]